MIEFGDGVPDVALGSEPADGFGEVVEVTPLLSNPNLSVHPARS